MGGQRSLAAWGLAGGLLLGTCGLAYGARLVLPPEVIYLTLGFTWVLYWVPLNALQVGPNPGGN